MTRAILATIALLTIACDGDGDSNTTAPPKPGEKLSADLTWVRDMVPGGAFAYSADRKIYVQEIDSDKPKRIGQGFMPEFSPDGSKIAWVDNDRLSVANRDGSDLRNLHDRMLKHGGAHWLDDEHLAAIVKAPEGYRWYRFALDGKRTPMPELDQFGIDTAKNGTRETDIKRAADGVWTHVAYRTWKTSDGKSAPLDGGCACSISPDASSITALQGSHTELKIYPVREGGVSHDLKWLYKGRFDNHRWSSNDERFLIGVREKPARMVVIDWRSGRAAAFGRDDHKDKTRMYGDLTKSDGKSGKAMPTLLPADQREGKAAIANTDRGDPVVLEEWPHRTDGMVYLYESRSAPNEFREFTNDPPSKSSGQLRGNATYDRFGRLDLTGGHYEVTSETPLSGDFSVEFSAVSSNGEQGGPAIMLGDWVIDGGNPTAVHKIATHSDGTIRYYENGKLVSTTPVPEAPGELTPIVFGKGWKGTLEGVAIFDRPMASAEVTERYKLIAARLGERSAAPQETVDAKLIHYTPPIPVSEMDTYRRLVCEHVFEVEKVIDGDLKPGQKIRVRAWSTLDMKILPETWKGKEGDTFRLTLEAEDAHPYLEKLERVELYEGDDALDMDGYFSITKP